MNAVERFYRRVDKKTTAGLGFESFAAGAFIVLSVVAAILSGIAAFVYGIRLIVWLVVTIGPGAKYFAFLAAAVAFVAFCYYAVRINNPYKEDSR